MSHLLALLKEMRGCLGMYGLVVHFIINVVVSTFLFVRQRKLLENAAPHVLANRSSPVE